MGTHATMRAICRYCNEPYSTQNVRQRYCKDACRDNASYHRRKGDRKQPTIDTLVICVCGKTFIKAKQHPDHKFCSEKCRKRSNRPPKPRLEGICELCERPFIKRLRHPNQRFCDKKCTDRYTARRRRARKRKTEITYGTCFACGGTTEMVARKRKYCSESCRRKLAGWKRRNTWWPGLKAQWKVAGITLAGTVKYRVGTLAYMWAGGTLHEVPIKRLERVNA